MSSSDAREPEALARRNGNKCFYCETELHPGNRTKDHVVPVTREGPTEQWNLKAACKDCNFKKVDTSVVRFRNGFCQRCRAARSNARCDCITGLRQKCLWVHNLYPRNPYRCMHNPRDCGSDASEKHWFCFCEDCSCLLKDNRGVACDASGRTYRDIYTYITNDNKESAFGLKCGIVIVVILAMIFGYVREKVQSYSQSRMPGNRQHYHHWN